MFFVITSFFLKRHCLHFQNLYRLEIWPGYVTTITRYEGGLLLMCDVSHKVIRQETVYDIIRGYVPFLPEIRKIKSSLSEI